MKIVEVDNYNRDYVDDKLICENVNATMGSKIVKLLNESTEDRYLTDRYFILCEDNYVLNKFEP